MLAQFQSLYPNGSLVSELVEIFQGKFIVRASVQIEGVTRATGMAAAETVEAAEDQARTRALMVLGMTNTPQTSVQTVSTPTPQSTTQFQPVNSPIPESTVPSVTENHAGSNHWSLTHNETAVKVDTTIPSYNPEISYPALELSPIMEDTPPMSIPDADNLPLTDLPPSNVTPFTPRNSHPPENVAPISGTGKKKKKAEPVDLSDVIAKTDVELQRLGWTPEQGREYLIKTYGKRGRTLLTEEELHSFLKYLESQPDPIAGF
ncbi:hypothetical protein CLI64_27150 [Nostoc sp. CENA543]|uniref:hypothetical protein n=1 Tax=Nostoc sp. CENA543 TaxID=1869241 RepID=UPI000CA38E2A|nr:hypothetical protein [Nostoc sp. CENA543]AUT03774.1 hypothetical protein CLI64_27150 [Nostoc sp. CENA543]